MADEVKEFAAWKYDTGSKIKNWLVLAVMVSIAVAMLTGLTISPWCFSLLAIPVGLVIHLWRADYDLSLMVANRYLILGETIIYYRNVSSARLDKQRETLTITTDRGRRLVVEAARFPTNARKADKIKANKSAKFVKVTGKIIERLKNTVPECLTA